MPSNSISALHEDLGEDLGLEVFDLFPAPTDVYSSSATMVKPPVVERPAVLAAAPAVVHAPDTHLHLQLTQS